MTESWDTIADWYARHLRSGSALHDFSRDILLDRLPGDLAGQPVLDVGCGEGTITRAVAERGATVLGIDPVPRMIDHARAAEAERPTGAVYAVDDAQILGTVPAGSAGWVTAGLALNNVPDLAAALGAIHRVLADRGHLVFTVPHPCFEAPHATWADAGDGAARRVVGDYLDEGFWRSSDPEAVRRAGNQHRMVSTYVNGLLEHGFAITSMAEPEPGGGVAAQQPERAGLPPFLLLQAHRH